MRILLTLVFALLAITANAKTETYDIATFELPQGWNQEYAKNHLSLSTVNKKKRTWCKIGLFKSIDSAGAVEADFTRDWKLLVLTPMAARDETPQRHTRTADGWTITTAGSTFPFDGAEALVMLTNLTGHGKTVTVVSITNTDEHVATIEAFFQNLRLAKPKTPAQANVPPHVQTHVQTNTPSAPPDSSQVVTPAQQDGFAFTTTRFDDGWVATVQPDWVEASKGPIRALLHYPREGTIFPADPAVLINTVWDKLVAPRYSHLRDYRIAPTLTEMPRGYLSSGTVTDKQSGRDVFVVLFRRDDGWIEIVAPNRQAFIQAFGLDPHAIQHTMYSDIWAPLEKLSGYNKFAVGAADLRGKWTNNFTGMQEFYNVYTGNSVGTQVNSSSQTFDFLSDKSYQWELIFVRGFAGNMQASQPRSRGTFRLPNNWQIEFSDIEGSPKLYDAYFTAIKGGRVLKMNDARHPGSGIFASYGRSK